MIVYTGGTFDVLHPGHMELLVACRLLAGPLTEGGRVVVSLNTDEFVEAYKGRPPVQPFAHRRELLMGLSVVDGVVRNAGGPDSRVAIDVVAPHVIAIGDDWLDPGHDERRYFAQLGVTPEWMAERNLRVVYVPRTRGVASRDLRAIEEAAEAVGAEPPRPGWAIRDGRVVRT